MTRQDKGNVIAVFGIALLLAIVLSLTLGGCSKSSEATQPVPQASAAVAKVAPHTPTVTAYNGLISADMGPIVSALEKQGDNVQLLWHDAQRSDTNCPEYIVGHSLGGNAAIRQAVKCQAAGRPPKAIVVIDAGRAPVTYQIPANAKFRCVSFYNPDHPIGGQEVLPDSPAIKLGSCHNTVVPGYDHIYMPSAPGIIRGTLAIVPAATH